MFLTPSATISTSICRHLLRGAVSTGIRRYCFSGFGRPYGGKLMGDMLLRDAKGDSYPPPSMLTGLPPTGLTSSDTTRFDVLTDTVTPIPQEHFRFHNYSELLASSNTQLPDIIGQLTAIKSSISDPSQGKDCVMATIQIDKYRVEMNIADETAENLYLFV